MMSRRPPCGDEMSPSAPCSDVDLWTDDALLDPYPIWRALRELGGAVWLERHGVYVLSRYDDVKQACANWRVFSSAHGVAMNEDMNAALAGGTLCSDPPVHDRLRAVIRKPLTTKALGSLEDQIRAEADALVERLVKRGSFDAAVDLAQHLPLTIVSNAVGLPEDGRERMLVWAAANFNCFGPMEIERTRLAFPIVQEMVEYAFNECIPGKLKPDGWAQMIWDAADRGEIPREQCGSLMNDYMGPSLDTTIFATTSAIWLFGCNPDQWDRLRSDPSLVPGAVNEVIRLESPIPFFSRYVTEDYRVDDVAIPAGSRVIVLWGSANRDERHWMDPERFDIGRRPNDHVGFGFGEHACAGQTLARMEMKALLGALVPRVRRFELGETERALNNMLRGLQRLDVTVE
jgi:cytochrome P450